MTADLRGAARRAIIATLGALLILAPSLRLTEHDLPSTAFAGEHDDEATPTPTATPTPEALPPKSLASPRAAASPEVARRDPTLTPTPESGLGRSRRATAADSGPFMAAPPSLQGGASTTSRANASPQPTATQQPEATPPSRIEVALRGLRGSDGLSLHVVQYTGLILGAASEAGVDPALIAALMETEGSGESAVSRAGAAGLMQLMPDKLAETDDAFDPATNILRAAQYIRRLVSAYNGDLAAVAAAYFGAIDREGNVTDDSDGNVTGVQYVMIFADAYQRWAAAFNQPTQTIAIRPVIRQRRPTPVPTEAAPDPTLDSRDGPDRDRWYLYIEGPQPAVAPVLF